MPSRYPLDVAAPRSRSAQEYVDWGVSARRRWWANAARIAVGLVLLAGAVLLFVALYQRPEPEVLADRYPVRVECAACNHRAVIQMPYEERFPVKCPKCRAEAAWPLWRCQAPGCGQEFRPDMRESTARCPACGSTAVGAAVPPPRDRP